MGAVAHFGNQGHISNPTGLNYLGLNITCLFRRVGKDGLLLMLDHAGLDITFDIQQDQYT
jgi:hypothetical protein